MLERILAVICLIVLLPIYVVISISILIFSGTPIFFKHKRCGYKHMEFEMYKFRTMYFNNGPEITKYNDDRISGIGKILRKYKIDEFPQLVNIIKGEMEFIGPRPETAGVVKKYPEHFSYLKTTKPGISDIGSMIFKDESKIFKNIDINKYEDEILPVKNHLALITSENLNLFKKSMLIFLSILTIIHHKLSLRIISKFFLPYDEIEFREKLNYLLSENIF
mgnify:CR=1 FL=1